MIVILRMFVSPILGLQGFYMTNFLFIGPVEVYIGPM